MGGRRAPSPPQLQAPREVPLSETFAKFLGQEAQIPALQSFADRLNTQFRQTLESGLPGTLGAASQVSRLVNELLGGTIPADVQAEVQRTAAERAGAIGAPATSEFARMLEARDFGLTSMGLMQQGAAYVPGLMDLSSFLSPQQAQNYLFSTGQIRGEDLKMAQDQANVANQNAINRYNYDVANARSSGGFFGQIGGLLGGIGGAALGSFVPGIGTAVGASLGSALGGSVGSYASGGAFAAPAGVGAIGSLLGQIDPSVFTGKKTAVSSGSNFSATAFSPTGQAFSLPTYSYSSPVMDPNWPYNVIGLTPPELYGGRGKSSISGM